MRCPHHDTPPLSIPSGILQKRSSHDQRIILRPRRLRCAAISSSSTPPFLFLLLVWIFCDCVTVFSREGKSTCCLLAISAFYIPSTSTRSACPKDGNSFVASGRQRHIQRYGLSHESRQQGTISLSLLSPNQQQQQQQQQPKMAAAHQYSSRKVASRKTQLRWITQTVQKIQARTSKGTDEMAANAQLVQALALLSNSRTQQQVLEAGRMLEAANISETQPVSIQERVVKAAAMTGLLRPALTLTEHMLLACKHLPAEICQDAVCNSLRRAGRIQRLERLLCQFGVVARTQNQQISLVAFNTYLAALCDVATGKDSAAQQQQKRGESGMVEGLEAFAQSRANYKAETLRQAWQWIQDPARTARDMAVLPDTVSYATVIQAAAIVGNLTLVDSIWKELKARNIQPNIVAYNARLRTVSVTSDGRERFQWDALGDIKKRDQEILAVWDNEIATDPYVSPDKYTIDLLLLPLIRAGRVGDVESLLDSFVKRNSETIVANAFTAFLLTVVGGGELATARALFETYILPTLSPVMVGDAGGMIRMVRPTTRHFNVLLEGYRKRMQNGHFDQSATDVANHAAADEGWGLYRLMIQSLGVRPDAYTITSMMGLCRTSVELSHLLFKAISDFGIDCSSVVLRAALTAYGDLGDASSALWLFSKFAPRSARTWNVLLGSLAKVAESGALLVLKPMSSNVSRKFQGRAIIRASKQEFTDIQKSSTLVHTVRILLDAMCGHVKINGVTAPTADSQTFCVAASALQYGPTGAFLATRLFQNATKLGIPADGRFVNAVMRCFGDDIDSAMAAWKDEIRPKCVAFENRARVAPLSIGRPTGKNLIASYYGLLYVCGRAVRPDIALRLVYAMNKENLETNENALNSYKSGRRVPKPEESGFRSSLERKFKLIDPYESLLYIECTKYDRNDRRRAGEKLVRIIL